MPARASLSALNQLPLKDRAQLALENIALRQQLAVYKRTIKRPALEDRDRTFWLTIMRMFAEWREALVFVQPEAVIRWHRKGFRHYWKRNSRSRPGRPPIDTKVILLIRRLPTENELWGAPRIHDEFALLRNDAAESTVAKCRPSAPSQSWRNLLANHVPLTKTLTTPYS